MSPVQRTLKKLRDEGWIAQKVEYWNYYAKKRIDLWGIIDILAAKPGVGIMGIQVTGTDVQDHVRKIQAEPKNIIWRRAGGLLAIYSWRKLGKHGRKEWACRIINFKPRKP